MSKSLTALSLVSVATVFAGAIVAGSAMPQPAHATQETYPYFATLNACEYEDGSGQEGPCLWLGHAWGNKIGESYIVYGGEREHILYLPQDLADILAGMMQD